ncbi:RNA polymerase sporulation-specific sigma factor [Lachnotalea glycerini]|uniref:RNA polymerase sigma factor n=1 Tax=Lachnotalea glycerini TaxID=1763509 RepID=A0A255IKG7_9FIRM|nr:RNA polymerase sporulation sigma factor SigF [Lachnotalea glycerini]PXV85981.1 RNA polymerase sporulation-specific sigma factor [Lachnotalea glycerini]RDY31414.1 RNA polymerase sporulation sigma factor SigF [Lachnotalea glycerini]
MEHTIALIEKSHQGDKKARDMLVEENMGLVWSIVKRFVGRGHEQEDLFQIGSIGLIKAIDKFDTSYEVKFSTYAVPMISGEIKRFLRDDGMVKVSRSLKENGYKIRQATQSISHEMGREATIEELAAATELSAEDIVMAMDASVEVESIYKTVYQGEGTQISLVDKLEEKNDEQEKLLDHMLLEQLLEILDEKEKKLIILRYYQDKTQMEVAKVLGISQVQVSRMEKKILLRMRQTLLI